MKSGYTSYIANLSVQQAQFARTNYGVNVQVDGIGFRMMTRSLKGAEADLIPQGTLNAAASDLRLFNASPADFTTGGALTLPQAESTLTWDGNSYTVIFAVTSDMSGIPVSIKIFAYRTPAPDSAGDETVQEAEQAGVPSEAGKRRNYAPPASTSQ